MSYYIWRQKQRNKPANMPYCHPIHSVRLAGRANSLKLGPSPAGEPSALGSWPRRWSAVTLSFSSPPSSWCPCLCSQEGRRFRGRVCPWVSSSGRSSIKAPASASQRYDPVQHSCSYGRMPLEGRFSTYLTVKKSSNAKHACIFLSDTSSSM